MQGKSAADVWIQTAHKGLLRLAERSSGKPARGREARRAKARDKGGNSDSVNRVHARVIFTKRSAGLHFVSRTKVVIANHHAFRHGGGANPPGIVRGILAHVQVDVFLRNPGPAQDRLFMFGSEHEQRTCPSAYCGDEVVEKVLPPIRICNSLVQNFQEVLYTFVDHVELDYFRR